MGVVDLTKDISIVDLGLFIPKSRTLVFSDFHVGYEEALTSRGALLPRFQFKDTVERLDKIFAVFGDVETAVINGDLKHDFGTISGQEWRDVLKLLDYFAERCRKIIIVKGNHDKSLLPITKKRNVEVVESYITGEILIAHGDKIVDNSNAKTIVIGHEHPALGIRENKRFELFKCFLKGKFNGKTLIVQPSFNLLQEGTDVLNSKFLSPYLDRKRIGSFEAFVVSGKGEIIKFGKISKIAKTISAL